MPRILFRSCLLTLVGILLAIAAFRRPAADARFEHMAVYRATPERQINHAIDWKGVLTPTRHRSTLVGPLRHSAAVIARDKAITVFNWYELSPAVKIGRFRVRISPASGDGEANEYQIEDATHFLSTTQLLGAGEPAEIPAGLGHYVAHRIVGQSGQARPLQISTDTGVAEFQLKQPAFLCLPVEEWHHDDYFPATESRACWVVYLITSQDHLASISTLDQFGLNTLQLDSAEWLCIPSTKFEIISDDS